MIRSAPGHYLMRRAIFPGSFDPLTNGHLDVIKRSAPLFDEMIVAVVNNPDKNPMFTVEERVTMINEILPTIDHDDCRMSVDSFSGLTAEFAKRSGCNGDRSRHSRRQRLRIRASNGTNEPQARTDRRDRFPDGG